MRPKSIRLVKANVQCCPKTVLWWQIYGTNCIFALNIYFHFSGGVDECASDSEHRDLGIPLWLHCMRSYIQSSLPMFYNFSDHMQWWYSWGKMPLQFFPQTGCPHQGRHTGLHTKAPPSPSWCETGRQLISTGRNTQSGSLLLQVSPLVMLIFFCKNMKTVYFHFLTLGWMLQVLKIIPYQRQWPIYLVNSVSN